MGFPNVPSFYINGNHWGYKEFWLCLGFGWGADERVVDCETTPIVTQPTALLIGPRLVGRDRLAGHITLNITVQYTPGSKCISI